MNKCLERKLLYHFLTDSVKIVHLFCTNCVISHTIPLQCVAFPFSLSLSPFLYSPFTMWQKSYVQSGIYKQTRRQTALAIFVHHRLMRIAFHVDSVSVCGDVFTGAGASVAGIACCCVHFSFDSFIPFCLYFSSS